MLSFANVFDQDRADMPDHHAIRKAHSALFPVFGVLRVPARDSVRGTIWYTPNDILLLLDTIALEYWACLLRYCS